MYEYNVYILYIKWTRVSIKTFPTEPNMIKVSHFHLDFRSFFNTLETETFTSDLLIGQWWQFIMSPEMSWTGLL